MSEVVINYQAAGLTMARALPKKSTGVSRLWRTAHGLSDGYSNCFGRRGRQFLAICIMWGKCYNDKQKPESWPWPRDPTNPAGVWHVLAAEYNIN